jgi:large subunit ribosomal protein L4
VRDVEALDPVALVSHEKVLITVTALKKVEEVLA